MRCWTVYFKSNGLSYGGIVYEGENVKEWWLGGGRNIKPLLFSSKKKALEKIKEIKTIDKKIFWKSGKLHAQRVEIVMV